VAPINEEIDPGSGVDRRKFIKTAGGASAAAALAVYGVHAGGAAASLRRPNRAADAKIKRGGVLTMSQNMDIGNADPNQIIYAEARSYARAIADCLVDQNPATGEIVPWLANKWSINKSATSFKFQLRRGVTYSNGEKFNAAAVKTAMDSIYALGPLANLASTYFAGAYSSTKVLGPYEVEINFTAPNSQFIQALAEGPLAPLSPNSYKEFTPTQRAAGQYYATGLYTIKQYTPQQIIELVPRKGYKWPSALVANPGSAYLDGFNVTWQLIDSTRALDVTSGQLDIDWPHVPLLQQYQAQIQQAGGNIYWRNLPGVCTIQFPNSSPGHVFNDINVRQAWQKAINRPQIASTIFWKGYPTVPGVLDAGTPGAANYTKLLAYDLKGAIALLEKSGWVLNNSDGYRYKNGQQLKVTQNQTSLPSASNSLADDLLIQQQVKLAGFNLVFNVVTSAQNTALEAAGNYDLVEASLARSDPHAMASWFDSHLLTTPPASLEASSSAEAAKVQAYFAKGLKTVNSKQRYKIYNELQEYIIQQALGIPVYQRRQYAGVAKGVHGFAFTSASLLRVNDIWKS
jgi:peptide/nickel transport system substrate-binding protein